MPVNKTNLVGIEQGRAKAAYDYAKVGKLISSSFSFEGEKYKDDKYSSYVKKIPMLIKTNGLGSTFAFVKSNFKKAKKDKQPGSDQNPKNAYDLIYKQTKDWLVSKALITPDKDLIDDIISKKSTEYRVITNEVLAFFNWLRRFAEGDEESE